MIDFPDIIAGQPWAVCMHNPEDVSDCAMRVELQGSGGERAALGAENGAVTFPGYGLVAIDLDSAQTGGLESGRFDVILSAARDGEAREFRIGSLTVLGGRR